MAATCPTDPSSSSDKHCFLRIIYFDGIEKTDKEILDELIRHKTFFECLEHTKGISNYYEATAPLRCPSIGDRIATTKTFLVEFSITEDELNEYLGQDKDQWTDDDWKNFSSKIILHGKPYHKPDLPGLYL